LVFYLVYPNLRLSDHHMNRITQSFARRCMLASSISAALIINVFCGCAPVGEEGSQREPVEVDFWVMWTGREFEAMADLVDKFNGSQDEIRVNALSVSDIQRKLLIATAGNDAPDVAMLTSDILPQFADKNALMPFSSYLDIMQVELDDYVPVFLELCSLNDELYGLPASTVSLALHWNKQMFREVGLDPDVAPRTIDELDSFAEKLTRKDESGDYISLGFLPTDPGWWPFSWTLWFGGSWVGEDGTPTANAPENIAAFEWVRSYSERFGVRELQNFSSSMGNFSSAQNAFFSGKCAMTLQGVWLSNFIEEYTPDLDWGAAAFPSSNNASSRITLVQCDALVIPTNARNVDAAAQFIGYIQQQESLNYLARRHGKFGPLLDNEALLVDHPNEKIGLFVELSESPDVRILPRSPIWPEYAAEIGQAFESVWLGSKTATEALDDVQKKMEKKWADYLRIREAIANKRK
jgi:multiple sugar transport system substrate-binding protein